MAGDERDGPVAGDPPNRARIAPTERLARDLLSSADGAAPTTRPDQPAGFSVVLRTGGTPPKEWALDGPGCFIIGRSEGSHLQLEDDSVSRRHAALHLNEAGCAVEDLKGANGTLVNGQPIDTRFLQSGDVLQVGSVRLAVEVIPEVAPMAAATDAAGPSTILAPDPSTAPGPGILGMDELLDLIASQSHFEQRYEVRQRIYSGGMGEILGGFDRIVGRDIGIKMALPKYAKDLAARRMFLREAKVAGCLLHPNILPVFDVGVNRERRIYYTMRLVNGTSLKGSLDSLSTACETSLVEFPLQKVMGVFLKVCEGVDYAHSRHVIHLDLKPDNILVSGFSEVFVIDWGLAQVEGRDETKGMVEVASETGATSISLIDEVGHRILGTPGYMAPEQWIGDPERFQPSTDVFGLGGILYYILYGTPPCRHKGVEKEEVSTYTLRCPPSPGDLRSGVFARGERVADDSRESLRQLEAVCMRSLQRDQGSRYQSAEAMIVDLREWLRATPF